MEEHCTARLVFEACLIVFFPQHPQHPFAKASSHGKDHIQAQREGRLTNNQQPIKLLHSPDLMQSL